MSKSSLADTYGKKNLFHFLYTYIYYILTSLNEIKRRNTRNTRKKTKAIYGIIFTC